MVADVHLLRAAHQQPGVVCPTCGNKHGVRKASPLASWTIGVCDVCFTPGPVTVPREFGYLKTTWFGFPDYPERA